MKNYFLLLLFVCFNLLLTAQQKPDSIHPGETWNDTRKQPINAHGGGILYDRGVYYWYGEIKKGPTTRVPGIDSWEDYRVEAGGVSCYASKDLVNWTFRGVALATEKNDSSSDIHTSRVVERPKVVYNDRTHQYVMWMHIDRADYSFARAGVAVSNSPTGPFHYLHSVQPNGQMSRDMTLFKDADGSAYLVYASENNLTMQICLLTDDYLEPTEKYKRILESQNREAPAMFRTNGKYYLVTSLCTGWDPNRALYAVADSVMGDWQLKGNPCTGVDADSTYHAQSSFIFPVLGRTGQFVFMADRWNKTDLEHSLYVWLPLTMQDDIPVIEWKDEWKPFSR